jgi:DNA (cytosine-5)-methyltransferase 1
LASGQPATGPINGFWRDADWLFCRDGKWRAVEPGTFPLAHGATARVGRLRAYGNAINAEAARIFIEAVTEAA